MKIQLKTSTTNQIYQTKIALTPFSVFAVSLCSSKFGFWELVFCIFGCSLYILCICWFLIYANFARAIRLSNAPFETYNEKISWINTFYSQNPTTTPVLRSRENSPKIVNSYRNRIDTGNSKPTFTHRTTPTRGFYTTTKATTPMPTTTSIPTTTAPKTPYPQPRQR